MLEDFRMLRRFRVPYGDVDMMAHVNHRAYLQWSEDLRSEYFADVLGEDIRGERGMIMVKLEFTYERQLDYREDVAIGVRITRIGAKSFDFATEIWSETHQARAATGTATLVAFDYRANASIPVPAEWRARITAFEAQVPA
jgi:acyl-CoA thioester hydrolase